jgi:hypothetical protein
MKIKPYLLNPYPLIRNTLLGLTALFLFMASPAPGEADSSLTDYLARLHGAEQTLKEPQSLAEWQKAKVLVDRAFPEQELITFPDGQQRNLNFPLKERWGTKETFLQTTSIEKERKDLLAVLSLYIHELGSVDQTKPLSPREQQKIKEQAEEILRSPEFSGKRQSPWPQKIMEWLDEWLRQLLGSVGAKDVGWLKYFAYGLMAILVLFILHFIIKSLMPLFSRPTEKKPGKAKGISAEEDFAGEDWAERALTLAEAGDFRGAVRACYLGILQTLEQERLLRYNRSKTNWEYLAELSPWPQLTSPMRELTLSFDYIWYGHQPSEPESYRQFQQGCRQIKDSLKGVKDSKTPGKSEK